MHRHTRQTDIYNPKLYKPQTVLILGAGNVGSHVAIVLAKMGIQSLHIIDFDTIEEHNLGSQAYDYSDIDQKKIIALQKIVKLQSPETNVKIYDMSAERMLDTPELSNFITTEPEKLIIISAVDSLEARNAIAEKLQSFPNIPLIDARMGQLQTEAHAIMSHEWQSIIPERVDEDPCGGRFISFTSYVIAGIIGNMVREIIKNGSTESLIMNLHNKMILKPSSLTIPNNARQQTTAD